MPTNPSRRTILRMLGAAAVGGPALTGRPAAARPGRRPPGLRFGIQTWQQQVRWDDVLDVWKEAEELGFDAAFLFDHFMPLHADSKDPCLEAWTLLGALAARTRRIGVGTLVTGNTYRHPAVLAKMAATLDHLSNGRLILGMGAAWHEEEHEAYGIPFHTDGGRARRLAEAVEIIRLLFTRDRPSYDGKFYRLRDAPFSPKAVQTPHPPILIGGMGPKIIQPLAARHADIWHFSRHEPDEARNVIKGFDALCRKVGREPSAVAKSMSVRDIDMKDMTTNEMRTRISALADAGIDYFILSVRPPYDRGALRRFAREVIPQVQKGRKTAETAVKPG